MIYRASTLSLSLSLSGKREMGRMKEGRKLRLDEIRRGQTFPRADRIIYATSSLSPLFSLFSRNNCRDNVASVWIPPLLFVLGKKAMVRSYNSQVAKVEAK